METAVARIRCLEGMDADLLARLARQSPTLLQLELLSSADAVRAFLNTDADHCSPLQRLDDVTLAQLAALDPSEMQMRILCTPGAVMEFIHHRMEERGEGGRSSSTTTNMVGRLQETIHPEVPTYSFTTVGDGFVCECAVRNSVQSAKAPTKQGAKQLAAKAMLGVLTVPAMGR